MKVSSVNAGVRIDLDYREAVRLSHILKGAENDLARDLVERLEHTIKAGQRPIVQGESNAGNR